MFTKKQTPYHTKYFLFGKCVWKHNKSVKHVSEYLLSKISDMCRDIKQNVDEKLDKTASNVNSRITNFDSNLKQCIKDYAVKSEDDFNKVISNIKSGADEKLDSVYDKIHKDILKISSKTDDVYSEIQSVDDKFVDIYKKINSIEKAFADLNTKYNSYKTMLIEQSDILKCLQQQSNHQMNKIHYLNAVAIKNEIANQGYILDKNWVKSFIRYRIADYELKRLQLKDLYIDDWQDKNMGTPVKIKDSPNYKYLSGDTNDYIKRCQNETSHSCEDFDDLIKNLEENGMNSANIISIDQNNHIIDGAHRASWLAYKYGEDYEITVLKVYFDNV